MYYSIPHKRVHDIPEYIAKRLIRYGLISVQDHKTKYGSIRVYVSFGIHDLLDLFEIVIYSNGIWFLYTRTSFYKSKGYYYFKDTLIGKLLRKARIPDIINDFLIIPYQKLIYKMVYRRAIRKFPNFKYNMLDGADYPELIE